MHNKIDILNLGPLFNLPKSAQSNHRCTVWHPFTTIEWPKAMVVKGWCQTVLDVGY